MVPATPSVLAHSAPQPPVQTIDINALAGLVQEIAGSVRAIQQDMAGINGGLAAVRRDVDNIIWGTEDGEESEAAEGMDGVEAGTRRRSLTRAASSAAKRGKGGGRGG